MVTSIIRPKSGEYVLFVCAISGRGDDPWGDIKTDSSKIYTLNEVLPFGRIKRDFNYGASFRSVTFADVYALDQMITHYPRERAKELFNAEAMVVYPFDLEGNVYEEKYDVCRAVAVARDGLSFFLYYMMTKDNFLNFDTFLNDMKGVFWFNDGPPPPKPEQPKRKNKVSYESITIDLNSDIPPSNLNEFFAENFKYPKGKTAKGTVIVDFVVNTSGKPEQFDVIKSLDKDFDAEVLRVLKKMPNWKPAISFDKVVESQHTITVKIDEKSAWIRGMDEAFW
jgi:TonB family protein